MNVKLLVSCGVIVITSIAQQKSEAAPVVTVDDLTDNVTVTGTGFNTVSIPFVGTFDLFKTAHFADANGAPLGEAVWFAGLGGTLATATKNGLWTEQAGSPNSDRFYIQTTAPVTDPIFGTVLVPSVTVGVFLSDPNLLPSVTIPPVNLVVGNVTIPIYAGTTFDFNRIAAPVVSAEPNGYMNISPSDGLTVNARSDIDSVPDSGNTLILLGLGFGGVLACSRRFGVTLTEGA